MHISRFRYHMPGFQKNGENIFRKKRKIKMHKEIWYLYPGVYLYRKIPYKMKRLLYSAVEKYMKRRQSESEEEASIRCQDFLAEELAVWFWGLVLVLILAVTISCWWFFRDHSIILPRRPFGQGDRTQEIILKDRRDKKMVSVVIGEREISDKDLEKLFSDFYRKLKDNLRGDNRSLSQVNKPLKFDDELKGYPFTIDYEPEDLSLIGLAGELGDEAGELKGESVKKTRIKVTASYKDWEQSKSYLITLIAPEKKEPVSVLYKTAEKLKQMEEDARRKENVIFPERMGNVFVSVPGSENGIYGIILLAVIAPHAWILRRFYRLREKELKRQKEAEEDFPIIVHLLTLYMKSGLSFASTVHRICMNHIRSEELKEGRELFEEITFMDKQMEMGVSQKDVCLGWAKRSRNALYRKLSMALIQFFVKGSKEGDRILELMEKEAFEQRIDRARKEGKKAETKLVLPMVFLLFMVMIIVLFPAIVRFQGF